MTISPKSRGRTPDTESSDFAIITIALHQDQAFIESQYEVRIGFIAPDYYRVHKRESDGWKVNMAGCQIREDLEVTLLFELWCDEVRTAFGGLDMLTIDVIVGQDGKQWIGNRILTRKRGTE
jgi:hypothetical protein